MICKEIGITAINIRKTPALFGRGLFIWREGGENREVFCGESFFLSYCLPGRAMTCP